MSTWNANDLPHVWPQWYVIYIPGLFDGHYLYEVVTWVASR